MGHARFRLATLTMVLGALSSVSAGVAQAEPRSHKATLVSGAGNTAGGLFTASQAGAVFELPSKARLSVSPGAALRLFPVPQELALTPGAPTTTWSFALQNGRVDIRMPSTGRNAVLGTMGKLSALVTNGHAALIAASDGATVANLEGDVRTLLGTHWQTVPVGSVATHNHDNPSALSKRGLAYPTLTSGQRTYFAPSDAAVLRGFRWAPVPGADHYELRVRRATDGSILAQRSTPRAELSESLASAEPGAYGLSLRSVDARGLESSWSPECELRVVGVVLPPGAFSAEQVVFVESGQQVQFTNTSGLEMTYVGANRFFPALRGASLYRNDTTLIGFRLPGAADIAVVHLEPRNLHADVSFGPKRALWPRDPISIDIHLRSKSGAEIPAFLQVVPKVSLGLEPLEVSFERDGNALHAVIPPRTSAGPWVLRVDVTDQFGVALGHDFLELTSEPRAAAPAVRIVRAPAPAPRAQPRRGTESVASSD